MLPGKDGISLCREYRQHSKLDTPILMLTARDTEDDKISGFEAGTDDYLVKPFSLRELEMRVLALTRRTSSTSANTLIRIADLELDRAALSVSRADQQIRLKPRAFRILEYLMQHPERVIPREELIEHIWTDDPPDGDPLRVHIHNLRQKIDKPFDLDLIHTVHGVGYRLGEKQS